MKNLLFIIALFAFSCTKPEEVVIPDTPISTRAECEQSCNSQVLMYILPRNQETCNQLIGAIVSYYTENGGQSTGLNQSLGYFSTVIGGVNDPLCTNSPIELFVATWSECVAFDLLVASYNCETKRSEIIQMTYCNDATVNPFPYYLNIGVVVRCATANVCSFVPNPDWELEQVNCDDCGVYNYQCQ